MPVPDYIACITTQSNQQRARSILTHSALCMTIKLQVINQLTWPIACSPIDISFPIMLASSLHDTWMMFNNFGIFVTACLTILVVYQQ